MKILLPFPVFMLLFFISACASIALGIEVNGWFGFIAVAYLLCTIEWWEGFPWITISRRKK
jgi:hypothetical protein